MRMLILLGWAEEEATEAEETDMSSVKGRTLHGRSRGGCGGWLAIAADVDPDPDACAGAGVISDTRYLELETYIV